MDGLLSGNRMPSENGLAERFSISRMTVRRAFDTLVHAGLVVMRQGRGTFVAPETTRQADGWSDRFYRAEFDDGDLPRSWSPISTGL